VRGRRRTGLVPPALAAAVAAVLLAGCGTVQMGAAAIVGNQRISSSALAAQVSQLKSAYQAGRGQVPLQFPPGQAPQAVLTWLIRFRIRDALAARQGITVTPGQQERALAALAAQIRSNGSTASLPQLAVANGIPPDLLGDLGRYQAVQTMLLNRLDGGRLPRAPSAQRALQNRFVRAECLAAKSLSIKINPQYGRFSYNGFQVVTAPPTLSAPETPSAPPASRPVLTPPC
jgi:hypothetical protein